MVGVFHLFSSKSCPWVSRRGSEVLMPFKSIEFTSVLQDILSAAADGKVNDQTLLQRGVRPAVPNLYKSAFPVKDEKAPTHIWFSAASNAAHYDVSLNNPLTDPQPAWLYKHELWERGGEKLASRGPHMHNLPNKEAGLAALKAVELKPDDPAMVLLRRLQSYVIYTPTT